MDRYNHSYANRHGYGTDDFRERADRSDRRYDEFYGNHSAPPIKKNMNWDRNHRYAHEETGLGVAVSVRPFAGEKRRMEKLYSDDDKHSPYSKRRHKSNTRESPRREKDLKEKETGNTSDIEDEIPEDEVVVPDSLMDSVEKLRMRKEVKRNAADEDIEKLIVFCFTGKGYSCKTCGLLMTKKTAFTAHLTSKSHIMNVIEARTAETYNEIRDILDMNLAPDDWFEKNHIARSIIMKQSRAHMRIEHEIKVKEEINFNRTPSNFYHFKMDLRKSIAKKDEKVIVTSLVESAVVMDDFSGNKFFGCEFVRAVTGYHCRLCSVNIRDANDVVPHVDSRQHRDNYATYIEKNPDYEKEQEEQKKELCDIMSEHPDKDIVLAESDKAKDTSFLSCSDSTLVRIPTLMDPELKKAKEKEMEMERKEREKLENEKKERERKEKGKKEKEKEKEKKEKEKEKKENERKEKERKEKEKKEKDKKEKDKKEREIKEKEKKEGEKKEGEKKEGEKKEGEKKEGEKKEGEKKESEKKESKKKEKEKKGKEGKEKKENGKRDNEKKEKEKKDKERKKNEVENGTNMENKKNCREIEKKKLPEKKKKCAEKTGKIEDKKQNKSKEAVNGPGEFTKEKNPEGNAQVLCEEPNNNKGDLEDLVGVDNTDNVSKKGEVCVQLDMSKETDTKGDHEREEERLSEDSMKNTLVTSPETVSVDELTETGLSPKIDETLQSTAPATATEDKGLSKKSTSKGRPGKDCVKNIQISDACSSVLAATSKTGTKSSANTDNSNNVGCFEVVDEVKEDCTS